MRFLAKRSLPQSAQGANGLSGGAPRRAMRAASQRTARTIKAASAVRQIWTTNAVTPRPIVLAGKKTQTPEATRPLASRARPRNLKGRIASTGIANSAKAKVGGVLIRIDWSARRRAAVVAERRCAPPSGRAENVPEPGLDEKGSGGGSSERAGEKAVHGPIFARIC